ncbi:MAG: hypothetical protein AB8W08_00635 [Coxiella endosymbiont of Dermacentor silvarum]
MLKSPIWGQIINTCCDWSKMGADVRRIIVEKRLAGLCVYLETIPTGLPYFG